MAMRQPP